MASKMNRFRCTLLRASSADHVQKSPSLKSSFMLPSIKAAAEAYEADPALVAKVRTAGGYDRELWRMRYREEALCAQGLFFAVSVSAM